MEKLFMYLSIMSLLMTSSFLLGTVAGEQHCTLPTAPVGTLSWATSTNTH